MHFCPGTEQESQGEEPLGAKSKARAASVRSLVNVVLGTNDVSAA